MEGGRGVIGRTASLERVAPGPGREVPQITRQPGLPDPGFSPDQHHPAVAAFGGVPQLFELANLRLPADQRSESSPLGLDPILGLGRPENLEQFHGRAHAPELELPPGLQIEVSRRPGRRCHG